jgi:hypothetical protein
VDLLGVALLGQRGESREIGEEHRHLPPLAFDRGAGFEDLVGEVPGGVSRAQARWSLARW